MTFWQKKLKEMPAPSAAVMVLDLFFILLAVFVVRTNFVYLPGIRSVSLPLQNNAEIISSEKHIVTLTFNRDNENADKNAFVYTFNGEVRADLRDLKGAVSEALQGSNNDAGRRHTLVLLAEKDIPYDELVRFYDFAREMNVDIFLATGFEKQDNSQRKFSQQ